MTNAMDRKDYADYLAGAIREESPWIMEIRAGVSLLAMREYRIRGILVRSGFIINLPPSPNRPRVGRVDPIILLEDDSSWRVVDSLWTLGRLAGGSTASAFSQNPTIMLDPSSGPAVVKKIIPRMREVASIASDFPTLMAKVSENSSVIGEKPLEEIRGILYNMIPYLLDREVDVKGKINVLLGTWSVEEFRRQYSVGLEVIRIIEAEAQKSYDNLNQLVRVDEFIALREEEFSLVRDEAEVTQNLSLGWIFYSLSRRPTGEMYTKEFYNELGRKQLDGWVNPEDVSKWKEIMIEGIKEILREWIDSRRKKVEEEPEIEDRSSALERMMRNLSDEGHKISGSLNRFF